MTTSNFSLMAVAALTMLVSGCADACYNTHSVGRVPSGVDTTGWTVVNLDQESDLDRFGVLVDMLEAAKDPQENPGAHEFVPDTRAKQREWTRIQGHLDALSLEQNNATANVIQYEGGLYNLVSLPTSGCVR